MAPAIRRPLSPYAPAKCSKICSIEQYDAGKDHYSVVSEGKLPLPYRVCFKPGTVRLQTIFDEVLEGLEMILDRYGINGSPKFHLAEVREELPIKVILIETLDNSSDEWVEAVASMQKIIDQRLQPGESI